MKALVLEDYMQLRCKDVHMPAVGPDDVLVRVAACGICGSDVHGLDGSTGRRKPPVIMGHEAAGVIAEVGRGVTAWRPGDRVTFDSTVYCANCWFCRQGEINLCENRRVLGVSCDEYRYDGAFAEYVAVPQRVLYRLPESISFEHAAMVEALSIAFHAVRRTPIKLGDTAVVVGTGMIGLLVVQTLRLAGCGQIIAVEEQEERLDQAKRLGADVALRSGTDNIAAECMALTGGRGADIAFDVVGVGAALQTAIHSLRKGGSLTLIGNLSPEVAFPLQAAVTRQLTLIGSCASCGEYPACLEMIARGAVNVAPLVSACAPLDQGAEWFQRLYQKEPGLMKVILKP